MEKLETNVTLAGAKYDMPVFIGPSRHDSENDVEIVQEADIVIVSLEQIPEIAGSLLRAYANRHGHDGLMDLVAHYF